MWMILLKLIKNKAVLAGAITLILSGYIYVLSLQLDAVKAEKIALAQQTEISNARVTEKINQIEVLQRESKNIAEALAFQQENTNRIAIAIEDQVKIFNSNHNLANIAEKKPKLVESRVNKATIKVFEQIEKETQTFSGDN